MACTGRYAEAWQYAAFWCVGSLLKGSDTSAAVLPGNAFLTDSQADFLATGVKANIGMRVYNLRSGLNGPITAVDVNTLTATGVLWVAGDHYTIVTIDANEIAMIENDLDIVASDIHAALAASNACNCTLAAWAPVYLAKLNIIEAGVFHSCPCADPKLSAENKRTYLQWINDQMDKLRDGRIEVCDGASGSEFPAIDWAEHANNEFSTARLIIKEWLD